MHNDRVRLCRILDQPLSLDQVSQAVHHDAAGAIASFVGTVRNHDGGQAVEWLDYSAHPLAEQRLAEVANEVAERHDVLAVAAEHRVGRLAIGETAVILAVSAAHRAPAFAACADLIDTLKQRVPIWKEQRFASGETQWAGLP